MMHLRNNKKKILHIILFSAIIAVLAIAITACSGNGSSNADPGESDGTAVLVNPPTGTDAADEGDHAENSPESSPTPSAEAVTSAPVTGTASSSASSSPTLTPSSTQSGARTPSQGSNATPSPTKKPTQAPTPKPTPTPTPKPTPKPTNAYNGNENFTNGKTIRFSHPSGFYASGFSLKFEYDSSYTVYYTTNGDEPTTSSRKYTTGISINDISGTTGVSDKVNVIRAAAYKNGKKVGSTVTATYIINKNAKTFEGRYNNLAVVSITTDKTNLYGSKGILTNYTEHGRVSERPAHVEFFDSDGTAGFSVDAGIRVYGGTSRALPQKSLKLVARKEYDPDNGKFKYAMLPDSLNLKGKPVDRFDSFILRAGGNDTLFGDSSRCTMLRDALIHTLAGKMSNVAFQSYRPVVVYINGTYSGLYNLRDDTDNDYLEQHYDVPKDEVAIVAYGHENGSYFYKVDEGTQADIDDYVNTIRWIATNNMANSANYKKACGMIDTDNFMKFIAVNVYANNRDWPHNNMRMWKYTGKTNSKYGQDGKWRFIFKDIDFSWGWVVSGDTNNVIASETGHNRNVLQGWADSGDHPLSAAFASLMKNSEFRSQFLSLMNEIMNNYFSPSTATAMISKMRKAMEPEMPYVISNVWYTNPNNHAEGAYRISATSVNQWKLAVGTLTTYANQRPKYMQALLKELYG